MAGSDVANSMPCIIDVPNDLETMRLSYLIPFSFRRDINTG
jgi:hypothetical protein